MAAFTASEIQTPFPHLRRYARAGEIRKDELSSLALSIYRQPNP